jgi:hypothetical protein
VCAHFVFADSSGNHRYFAAAGVDHAQHNQNQFRFRRAAFYSQLKSKVGNILAKVIVLYINLHIVG